MVGILGRSVGDLDCLSSGRRCESSIVGKLRGSGGDAFRYWELKFGELCGMCVIRVFRGVLDFQVCESGDLELGLDKG